jgi:hypothetical protein
MSILAGLRLREQSTVAAVAYTCGNTGHVDIAPLEEYRSSMKGSHTNLASVDKRLDMMGTHQVMALLADHRDRFCWCYPMAVHSNSSSPGTISSFTGYAWWLTVRLQSERRVMSIGTLQH